VAVSLILDCLSWLPICPWEQVALTVMGWAAGGRVEAVAGTAGVLAGLCGGKSDA